MVKFSYYGHACFLLDDGKYKVLVDPFITGNPKATVKAENVKCDFVLVSHAHGDHLGNAPEIAYNNGAAIVSTPEVISEAESIGRLTCHPMNLGGSLDLPFGRVEGVDQLDRRLTQEEYDRVVDHLMDLGLEDGFVQELSSSDEKYIPSFDLTGVNRL